jgi:hypothetical protein
MIKKGNFQAAVATRGIASLQLCFASAQPM